MKIIRRIFLWFVVITITILTLTCVFLQTKGRELLAQNFSNALNRDVKIREVRYVYPAGFQLYDTSVDGLIIARRIRIFARLSTLWQKEYRITELKIIEPKLTFLRLENGKFLIDGLDKQLISPSQSEGQPGNSPYVTDLEETSKDSTEAQIFIDKVVIEEGEFQFKDLYVNSVNPAFDMRELTFDHTAVTLTNIKLPMKQDKLNFDFLANVKAKGKPLNDNRLKILGWMDYEKKDMDAALTLFNLDGSEGASAQMISENNHMQVSGVLSIHDLNLFNQKSKPSQGASVDQIVLGALSSMNVAIDTQFSFETLMDDFQIKNISFSGNLTDKGVDKQKVPQ